MTINNNTIIHNLEKMRLNKSVCLSVDEKSRMLQSVFATPAMGDTASSRSSVRSTPSPFISMFSRYAVYALPAFILGFIGLNYGQNIVLKSKLAYQDFNTTKSEIELTKASIELKNSLSKTTKDISALKSFATTDNTSEKNILISQVSTGAKSIRNQVAALVKENKITEAKEVVLTLETALKADELYKVAPAVQSEVSAATDLRVNLEKKETLATIEATSTDTAWEVVAGRVQDDKKEFADIETEVQNNALSASTSVATGTADLMVEAKKYLSKAEDYLVDKDTENAIISLQVYDRIVAEVKLILLK